MFSFNYCSSMSGSVLEKHDKAVSLSRHPVIRITIISLDMAICEIYNSNRFLLKNSDNNSERWKVLFVKFEQIEQVLELARTGTFSQTARNLYMSQSNLSLSIVHIRSSGCFLKHDILRIFGIPRVTYDNIPEIFYRRSPDFHSLLPVRSP